MRADVTVRCPNCDGPLSMAKGTEVVDGVVRVSIPDSCVWCHAVIKADVRDEPFMLVSDGVEWRVVTKRCAEAVFRSRDKITANAIWVSLNDIVLQRPPLDVIGGRHD